MAPGIQAVVQSTHAWLQASWHVQVPFAWLEACVEWIQEEAGGAGRVAQQQINQQTLDQWLLTDLRDLDYPVLPEGLAQAHKTELSGTFCVQVDSLLDISQPAYGQLQKCRGTDCGNDEVSAVTQSTQRPWEARPTRVLLLQVTDGVQSLEAMEYQPIPALSAALRPGAKLQLQGKMVCRLGMLLLGPSNIKVLGGEVEDLVDRNNQARVLCRTLGLPEEQQAEQRAPPAPRQVEHAVEDLQLDDAELLASLEAQEEVERDRVGSVRDSGYGTQSSRHSSVSATSSRSEASTRSYRSGLTQSARDGSIQDASEPFDLTPSRHESQPEIQAQDMAEEDFPDEDFDDLPLDELDGAIFQQTPAQSDISHRSTAQSSRTPGNPNGLDRTTKAQTAHFEHGSLNGLGSPFGSSISRSVTQKRDVLGRTKGAPEHSAAAAAAKPAPSFSRAALEPSRESEFRSNADADFTDEDMDCFLDGVETYAEQPGRSAGGNPLPAQPRPDRDTANAAQADSLGSTLTRGSSTSGRCKGSALTLTSPPFTYLCLLEDLTSRPRPHATEIRVKAFIVTLLGKLSSSNSVWSVCVTISDGTGYLDVELSDEVLTGLLGFSVAGKAALKRDPARRAELDAGMRRCQEELVDMCCVMTIVVEPKAGKSVVTKVDQVSERLLRELEVRVRDTVK